MNSAEIKAAARSLGADLVGISPVARFDGMPEDSDPRTFAPGTRSVIAIGYRILRGSLRGVEEGTSFSNTYKFFGSLQMERMYMSRIVYDLCCMIENTGAEAVPVLSNRYTEKSFAPDYKAYAHAAGLGSTGKGGFFLTPEYGHRQRIAFIFTTLELEGDEVIECDFCRNCDACIKECPLGAYKEDGSLDLNLCRQCRNGASVTPGGAEDVDRCSAACARACMVALEEKIGKRFEAKFRKRSVWKRGIHGEVLISGNQFTGGRGPEKFEGK